MSHQFSSVQSFSRVWLFVTPWTAARQASLSVTNSQSLLKLISIESVMPSKHLILCHPLLLLPLIFPRIRVFSNFLQRRQRDGQQTHKKISSIANYQRHANRNCNEISPHTNQNAHHLKNLQIINTGKGVQNIPLCCWWECKLFHTNMWNSIESP